ncbi:MAG: hypothetical protein GX904_01395 [Acholeplasmataceae bacterium]|nr:hypothetical protein [Acholeplasmataceae bacterium]
MKITIRKLLTVGMLLIAGFVLLGCKEETTTKPTVRTTTTYTPTPVAEQIDAPKGLKITGQVLSWEAVPGATGYVVYVNDVAKATVSTTSYDFTLLTGDKLVFKVKAKASTGKEDSVLSVSVAYQANAVAQVSAIKTQLADLGIAADSGFAEELVRKGMSATEFESAVAAFETFVEGLEDVDDPAVGNALIKQLLAEDVDLEALVSGVVVALLPDYLEAMAEGAYPEEVDMYQGLIEMIEEDPDTVVLAIVTTLEYFIAFQEDITDDFLAKIMALAETEDIQSLNTAEVIIVKDEIVDILTENLPTTDQLVLVYNCLMALSEAMSGIEYTLPVVSYEVKSATQTRLAFQAMIALIDTIDAAYIDKLKEISVLEDTYFAPVDAIVLTLKYVRTFLDSNEALLNQIDNVFSAQEKAALFNYMIDELSAQFEGEGFEEGMGMDMASFIMLNVMLNLEYEATSDVIDLFFVSLEQVLDVLIKTDGELMRTIIIDQQFYSEWEWDSDKGDYIDYYGNYALNVEYDNGTEYDHARTLANMNIVKQLLIVLDAVIEDLTAEDANDVSSFLLSLEIPDLLLADVEESELPENIDDIVDDAEKLLVKILPMLLKLGQDGIGYMVDKNVIDGVKAVIEDVNSHYVTLYGEDYRSNNDYWIENDGEYEMVVQTIFVSDHVAKILTPAEKANVLAMIASVFDAEDLVDFIFMMSFELEEPIDAALFEQAAVDAFNFFVSEVNVFRTYNKASITQEQKNRISAFPDSFMEFFADVLPA